MSRDDLARLFGRERRRWARRFPDLASSSLWLSSRYASPTSPGRARDAAWCDPRTLRIHVCARVLDEWSDERLHALLLHELGHLADAEVAQPGAEARADRIAFDVTGLRIHYDDEGIQTTGPGGSRPPWLHR